MKSGVSGRGDGSDSGRENSRAGQRM